MENYQTVAALKKGASYLRQLQIHVIVNGFSFVLRSVFLYHFNPIGPGADSQESSHPNISPCLACANGETSEGIPVQDKVSGNFYQDRSRTVVKIPWFFMLRLCGVDSWEKNFLIRHGLLRVRSELQGCQN